jgi:hypothetical protein
MMTFSINMEKKHVPKQQPVFLSYSHCCWFIAYSQLFLESHHQNSMVPVTTNPLAMLAIPTNFALSIPSVSLQSSRAWSSSLSWKG